MTILTVGHSNHDIATFLELLARHDVTAVADVRSVPASRFTPQFNRRAVETSLRDAGIAYVFLGDELGARTDDASCYVDGRVHYDLLARTESFALGIERVLKGAESERIAIMCTEQDPLDCHRTVLISRELEGRGAHVSHILADGQKESHEEAMGRLMARFGMEEAGLFMSAAERLEHALTQQELRIAYVGGSLHQSGTDG